MVMSTTGPNQAYYTFMDNHRNEILGQTAIDRYLLVWRGACKYQKYRDVKECEGVADKCEHATSKLATKVCAERIKAL